MSFGSRLLHRDAQLLNQLWQEPPAATLNDAVGNDCAPAETAMTTTAAATSNDNFDISASPIRQDSGFDALATDLSILRAMSAALPYVRQEQTVFEALCELFPQAKRRNALRLVAMASIGAMRLAIEAWSQDDGKRALTKYLQEVFANLKAEI